MSHPIIYIDVSEIRKGKYEELKKSVKDLAAFVEVNVPRLIQYSFFFNKDRTEMTVISVHPDSESLEFHMDKGREEFRKFSEFLDLLEIKVYGHISNAVLEQLHQKAQMLGNATVTVDDFSAGFSRIK